MGQGTPDKATPAQPGAGSAIFITAMVQTTRLGGLYGRQGEIDRFDLAARDE